MPHPVAVYPNHVLIVPRKLAIYKRNGYMGFTLDLYLEHDIIVLILIASKGHGMGLSVKPKTMVKFLENNNFIIVSQKGSHAKLKNATLTTIVPMHNRDLDAGTLRAILRDTNLTKRDLEIFLEGDIHE